MRNKLIHDRRNKMIYQYYCTRWGDGFREEVIFKELGDQYHISEKTAKDVVRLMRKKSQEVSIELEKKQLDLFDENADSKI
jgi:hypothetical protein